MAKADTHTTATTTGEPTLPPDQGKLIEALTAAIIASCSTPSKA